ncbi:MAG: helix-turn-helix domain-containing protein [Actinomycetota bacterium]
MVASRLSELCDGGAAEAQPLSNGTSTEAHKPIPFQHAELAWMIEVKRECVTRALSQLRRGVIETRKGEILVRDPKRLRQLVDRHASSRPHPDGPGDRKGCTV